MKKTLSLFLCASLLLLSSCARTASVLPPVMTVLGDSIATGYRLEGTEQCYAEITANNIGCTLYNDAVVGHTAGDLLELIKNDDKVRSHVCKSKIIVISVGGNDLLSGAESIVAELLTGKSNRLSQVLEKLSDSFGRAMAIIKELAPAATVYVQTIYNPFYFDEPGLMRPYFEQINDVFKAPVKSDPSLYSIIDVHKHFEGHPEYIADDHIHPSAAGHKKIAELLTSSIRGSVSQSTTSSNQPIAFLPVTTAKTVSLRTLTTVRG